MSEPEATTTANGSAPPGDASGETAPENKDVGKKENMAEKKDVEEDMAQNGVKMVETVEEGKEAKAKEIVSMVEGEDVKMKEAEYVKEEEEEEGKEGEEGKPDKMEEGDDTKEETVAVDTEIKIEGKEEANGSSRKRARGEKANKEGEAKKVEDAGTKEKDLSSTPLASSTERPVRERKSVERLVEVIEKGPSTHFKIEEGRGTPLKDIPNVAYKLARKKPADLKLLHQTLFGRRGKAVNFKNNILQFSGFVWHEKEEKQRARIKEKLDKCVKDTLLDLCELFDVPVAKATTRKEDLVVKLLDFMAAPYATTDVVLAEKEQESTKSRKRKRVAKGSTAKSFVSSPVEQSGKRRAKSGVTPKAKEKNAEEMEDGDEEEEEENGAPDEYELHKHSESDGKESESQEEAEEDDKIPDKGKKDVKKSSKRGNSSAKEKVKARSVPKKVSLPMTTKSPSKRSSFTLTKEKESNDIRVKAFSRKKKDVDSPKKKATPKSDPKKKPTGKKHAKVKGKLEDSKESGPSQKALREKICEILKEVDFNTATFTDILKQLATHYKTDLTPRKKSIKLMIQEELTKLADEEENEDDEEDEGGAEDDNQELMGKEVKA